MRGKDKAPSRAFGSTGITPAHAGKSRPYMVTLTQRKDHPRPCGEKDVRINIISHLRGSPPPMRGKAARAENAKALGRITPAHAGKRALSFFLIGLGRDHPRPCGEKEKFQIWDSKCRGSPPPMRGKVLLGLRGADCGRITPAHAGKRK